MILRPQPGKQEDFLRTKADIALYGGSAGSGKTFALLIECVRHLKTKGFGAVIFRRESGQIANEGSLWDTCQPIYGALGAQFTTSPKYTAKFPKYYDNKIVFSHLQHDKHVRQHDGAQYPLICFDELQAFTAEQFWYMLSRNRTTCGVKPYVRATLNPDPNSFLLPLLEWWIDQETGYPIDERSGVIRYFIRKSGVVYWADTKEELEKEHGEDCLPKSFTFISAKLEDNQELLKANPEYKANIEAMLDYERLRLSGNWFATPSTNGLFKRHYFEIINESDIDRGLIIESIRYWDRASTEPHESNQDPDYTAGVLVHKYYDDTYIVEDVIRDRLEPADVENLIKYTADSDGKETIVGLEQEPGGSGKAEVSTYLRLLEKFDVRPFNKTKNKLTCWKPSARLAKNNKIKIVRSQWNRPFLQEAETVTDGSQNGHDDQIDAFAGAISHLLDSNFGVATFKEGA